MTSPSGERRSDAAESCPETDALEGAPVSETGEEKEEDLLLTAEELLAPEDAVEERPSELEALRHERDEYLDALRRLQAEFDNYRKRTVRQQTELLGRAAESLIERLLPLLDALDLAIAHAQTPDVDSAELAEALQQIGSLGRVTLDKEGLERIDSAGVAFDPNVHDAVAHMERAEGDPEHGVVVDEVLRPGYQLKGKVLRPAMVRVRG